MPILQTRKSRLEFIYQFEVNKGTKEVFGNFFFKATKSENSNALIVSSHANCVIESLSLKKDFMLLFCRQRHGILVKCVRHVQHAYFLSINQIQKNNLWKGNFPKNNRAQQRTQEKNCAFQISYCCIHE